jgi:ABC-type glycerol-3-phosphate transport system permease component
MIMPDVLIVENYRAISAIGLLDTIPAIALPYLASAFAIFLLSITVAIFCDERAGLRLGVPCARMTMQ